MDNTCTINVGQLLFLAKVSTYFIDFNLHTIFLSQLYYPCCLLSKHLYPTHQHHTWISYLRYLMRKHMFPLSWRRLPIPVLRYHSLASIVSHLLGTEHGLLTSAFPLASIFMQPLSTEHGLLTSAVPWARIFIHLLGAKHGCWNLYLHITWLISQTIHLFHLDKVQLARAGAKLVQCSPA